MVEFTPSLYVEDGAAEEEPSEVEFTPSLYVEDGVEDTEEVVEDTDDPNSWWKIALRTGLGTFPGFFSNPVQKPEYDPTESEGVAQEAFEGIGSGLTKIVQGVGEAVALVPDLAFGTNIRRSVTKGGESFREAAGIDPVGVTGSIFDVGAQFVLPAGVAIKMVTGPAKAVGFLNKAIVGAKRTAAAIAADTLVATEGTNSFGDLLPDSWWGGEITNTRDDIGLEGRQEAWRGITNKFKIGFEGGLAQIVVPPVLSTVGQGISKTALGIDKIPLVKYVGPVKLAQGIRKVAVLVGRKTRSWN